MNMPDYLSLTDYSAKYRVSISTLRRRIKNGLLPFKLDNGRYLIADAPMEREPNRPSQMADWQEGSTDHSLAQEIWALKKELVDLKTWILALEDEISKLKRLHRGEETPVRPSLEYHPK